MKGIELESKKVSLHGNGYTLQYSHLENFMDRMDRISWTEEPGKLQLWGRKELDTTERLTILLFLFHGPMKK